MYLTRIWYCIVCMCFSCSYSIWYWLRLWQREWGKSM